MKKIFLKLGVLVALIGGVSLSSCNSLDLAPEDYFGSGNYWQNEPQVNSYMIGIHSKFRDRMFDLYWLGEGRSKLLKSDVLSTLGTSMVNTFIIKSNLTQTSPGFDNWVNLYGPIFDCNLFIKNVEAMDTKIMSTASKNKYLGQAYGLRAYFYFTLLRTYDGVPLITEPRAESETDVNKLYTARSTAQETMNLIKEDLQKSNTYYEADGFTNAPGRCFWSKAATKTLTGEVYLWSAKVGKTSYDVAELNTALTALQSIPVGSYGLADKFLETFTTKGNKEIIMSIYNDYNNAIGGYNPWIGRMLYPSADISNMLDKDLQPMTDVLGMNAITDVLQQLEYKIEVFDLYDELDIRKRNNFLEFYKSVEGNLLHGTVQSKYIGSEQGGVRRLDNDYIVYRYADVLLMIAEIKNALDQDPSPEINAVRERAYRDKDGVAKPYPAYTNGGFSANELAIYFERVKELVIEGKAWYDLLRMQATKGGERLVFTAAAGIDGVAVLDKAKEGYKTNWPIGNNVLNNDKLVLQNPDWLKF